MWLLKLHPLTLQLQNFCKTTTRIFFLRYENINEAMGNKTLIVFDYSPTNVHRYPAAVKAGGLVFLSGVRPSNKSDSRRGFNDIPVNGYNKKQGFSMVDSL